MSDFLEQTRCVRQTLGENIEAAVMLAERFGAVFGQQNENVTILWEMADTLREAKEILNNAVAKENSRLFRQAQENSGLLLSAVLNGCIRPADKTTEGESDDRSG